MQEVKKQLRKTVAQKKAQHPEQELMERSGIMHEQLERLPIFQQAQTILLYYSLKDEVQTHAFVEKWSKTKNILLPVVVGEDLELRRYTGKKDLRTNGPYNIEEPTGELFTCYGDIDVAIIPGVAFDANGNRLGRGKGYYDRLLPKLNNSYNIGICFSFQAFDEIPAEVHDVKMNCILTEEGIFNGK